MGELLRAILDRDCTYSGPAFYTARNGPFTLAGGAGSATFQDKLSVIQCKPNTWFLCTGWAQSVTKEEANTGGTVPFWSTGSTSANAYKNQKGAFSIKRMRTGEVYSTSQQNELPQQLTQNFLLNNFVTLPEYLLFEPNELIGVLQTVPTSNTGANSIVFNFFVTLAGIEYQFPAGKG